jgi:hypothetical protein
MFDIFSKLLRLCGNGEDNNWSVRVADYFFVDCACCIFWRGAVVGAISGGIAVVILGLLIKFL